MYEREGECAIMCLLMFSTLLIKNIIEACDAIPMKKVIGDESNPKIIKEKVRKSRIEAIKSKINTE